MRGSITRLNRKIDCGFIRGEDGLEACFDLSSVDGVDIERLSIGVVVEYEEHFGHERLQARNVKIVTEPRSKFASGG